MLPEIWGSHGWIFLHTITFNYPENPTEKDKYYNKQLFNNLKYTLPCKTCSNHYSDNLEKFPLEPALESKEKFVNWLIDIHNEVNKKNGKRIYSYEEVYKIYKDMYNVKTKTNNINIILIIIIFLILIYYLYQKYKDYF